MTDKVESIWLGRMRNPMRMITIASTAATAFMAAWLIAGQMFFATGIGLKQFLSPTDTPSVLVTMIAGSIAMLSASIYFSDRRGMIEQQPEGFFDIVSLIFARLSMIATAVMKTGSTWSMILWVGQQVQLQQLTTLTQPIS